MIIATVLLFIGFVMLLVCTYLNTSSAYAELKYKKEKLLEMLEMLNAEIDKAEAIEDPEKRVLAVTRAVDDKLEFIARFVKYRI